MSTSRARDLRAMLELVTREAGGLESLRVGGGLEEAGTAHDPLEAASVQSGVTKLLGGLDVSELEVDNMEAIVMPRLRPVTFVKNDRYERIAAPWQHLNDQVTVDRLSALIPAVGRVEVIGAPFAFGATAFLVGDGLLMTNRHVARHFADGVGDRQLQFRSGEAAINFKREVISPAGDTSAMLDVKDVLLIHPYWDMALMSVAGMPANRRPLTLANEHPDQLVGREVVVVGYPARDDRNSLDLQDRIFERRYDVKRLQPGKVRERQLVGSFGRRVSALTHDASTLGGNSGSAVICVRTGHVLALHFGGIYLVANYAVPAWELGRDGRVADRGVRFHGPAGPPGEWEALFRAAEGAGPLAVQVPATSRPSDGTTLSCTIPLQLRITVGAPVSSAAAAVAVDADGDGQVATEARAQIPIMYPRLAARRGFRGDHLGLSNGEEVPLPALTARGKQVAAELADGTTELKYHRFSVVMHKGRRLAMFTAANVDYRREAREPEGVRYTREVLTGIPEGVHEQWVMDPRIDEAHQLPDVLYTHDGGAFDKGHLIRRDDVCWGRSFRDIQKANGDTYYTTNCSPQTAAFNRAADLNWGKLENLVQSQGKRERLIVLAGPVLADDDGTFVGAGEQGTIELQVPRRFWKIVVAKGAQGPEVFAFVLEQDLEGVVEELTVPSPWRVHMRSVAELEQLMWGWVSLDWYARYDQFDGQEGRRLRRGL